MWMKLKDICICLYNNPVVHAILVILVGWLYKLVTGQPPAPIQKGQPVQNLKKLAEEQKKRKQKRQQECQQDKKQQQEIVYPAPKNNNTPKIVCGKKKKGNRKITLTQQIPIENLQDK